MIDCYFVPTGEMALVVDALIRFAEAGNVDKSELMHGLHECWLCAGADGDHDVARIVSTLELYALWNEIAPVDFSGWFLL